MEKLLGRTIDNYQITEQIGKGGMGIVYKAYDTKLERYVAIKILNSQLFKKERFVERFKREAKNQAKLLHPNIVTVYGFIEYQGLLGIVMEYVEGESLEKMIFRQGRIHLYDAVYIMKQILAGIGYAHSKGFVHRDIKPSNIIFNAEGVAKIMDFGISKSLFEKDFTKTGAKVGTLFYMSPEQIKGTEVTQHTDIYSLGCTFYEMIVGKPPFEYDSEYKVMGAHINEPPPKISKSLPGMPVLLDQIVVKSLSKNPDSRQSTCDEFIHDLLKLDEYIAALQEKMTTRTKPNPKKTKLFSIFGFIIFIAALLGLSYFAYSQVDSLLKNKGYVQLEKYSFERLFDNGKDSGIKLSKFVWLQSGVNYNLNSIYFADNNDGIVVGDSGTILITNDGKNWNQIDLRNKSNFNDGYISKDGKCIVVGQNSNIFISDNDFATYKKQKVNGDYSLFKIYFVNDKKGFIVGSGGIILKTDNGGDSWSQISSGTTETLYDIVFTDQKNGYICGWNGLLLKTKDSGQNWNREKSFSQKYIRDIDFYNKDLGIAVGGGDDIYLTDDGGDSWEAVPLKQRGGIQKVKFITNRLIMIPGNRGELIVSDDAGEHWSLIDTKSYLNFSDIAKTKNGNIFVVGVNGKILEIQ